MYSPASYDHSTEMLDTFFEAGGNTLDTAHIYGGGNSERLIGLWMKERGNRDKVFLIDKGDTHTVVFQIVFPQNT